MENCIISGQPNLDDMFFQLMKISDSVYVPNLFGRYYHYLITRLFQEPSNQFSFQHTCFYSKKGKIAGMILFYTGKEQRMEDSNKFRLMWKLLKAHIIMIIPRLIQADFIMEFPEDDEMYISNIAVFPEFSRQGIATSLIKHVVKEAKSKNIKRILLDVRADNKQALKLYVKLGFSRCRQMYEIKVGNKEIQYYTMVKVVS